MVLENLDADDDQETSRWIERIAAKEVLATAIHSEFPHPRWHLGSLYTRGKDDSWAPSWEGHDKPVSDTDIRESVAMMSVPRMARESDLVVKATILSRRDIGVPGNSFPEYVIEPVVLLKGAATGNLAVHAIEAFPFVDGKMDGTQWRAMLRSDLKPGTQWYLFLRRNGEFFEPTAAWRSVFLIDGEQLLEKTRVPSCYTTTTLEREVRGAFGR